MIPQGQRSSQVLREYFLREVGPGFRFDAFMREYIAGHEGHTLAEAVEHWHATRARAAEPHEVGARFEFNRFPRDWYARHPGGPAPTPWPPGAPTGPGPATRGCPGRSPASRTY